MPDTTSKLKVTLHSVMKLREAATEVLDILKDTKPDVMILVEFRLTKPGLKCIHFQLKQMGYCMLNKGATCQDSGGTVAIVHNKYMVQTNMVPPSISRNLVHITIPEATDIHTCLHVVGLHALPWDKSNTSAITKYLNTVTNAHLTHTWVIGEDWNAAPPTHPAGPKSWKNGEAPSSSGAQRPHFYLPLDRRCSCLHHRLYISYH